MRFVYQPSFLDSTRQLSRTQAARLLQAVEQFQHAMEHQQWPQGVRITHLREDHFEFRVDLHMRVLYRRAENLIQYVLCGSHDQIRRVLRTL